MKEREMGQQCVTCGKAVYLSRGTLWLHDLWPDPEYPDNHTAWPMPQPDKLTVLQSENARLRLQRDTLALYSKEEMNRTTEGRTDWALYDAAESVLDQIKHEPTP